MTSSTITTQNALPPCLPSGSRNKQTNKEKRKNEQRKKVGGGAEKGVEEGEKEMEMESAKVSGGSGLAGPFGSCDVLP